jgi:hypothetical protein
VDRMLAKKTGPLDPALLQALTAVDKKKIKAMLCSDPVQNMPKYVRELETMLAGRPLPLYFSIPLFFYFSILLFC